MSGLTDQTQEHHADHSVLRLFQRNLLISMPEAVFLNAARLRARNNIKTPDALHLATARFHGCTALWTNDDRLLNVAPDFVCNVLRPTA